MRIIKTSLVALVAGAMTVGMTGGLVGGLTGVVAANAQAGPRVAAATHQLTAAAPASVQEKKRIKRFRVKLVADRLDILQFQTITLSGRVKPLRPGQRVFIQTATSLKANGKPKWDLLERVKLNRESRFSYKFVAWEAGSPYFRVIKKRDGRVRKGKSPKVMVAVAPWDGTFDATLTWETGANMDLHVRPPWSSKAEEAWEGQQETTNGLEYDSVGNTAGCGAAGAKERVWSPAAETNLATHLVYVVQNPNDGPTSTTPCGDQEPAAWHLVVKVSGRVILDETGTGTSDYFKVGPGTPGW